MANAKIDTKEAVAEINKLIDQFNLLIKVTGDVSTISKGNFRKVETALQGLKTIAGETSNSFKKMNEEQKRNASINSTTASTLNKTAEALNKVAGNANKATNETKKLNNESKKTTTIFGQLFGSVKSLVGAFGLLSGIQIFANLLKSGYALVKQFDSISLALKTVARDSFEAATAQRFLLEITEDFGVELASTAERYVRFLAAAKQSGVTLKDTEDIFRSMTKAGAVLGLQTDDLSTVYLALEQMMSKGKVTTEELRRQLGEKLPGAVGIMAAAIGVGVEELDSLLKKGEVLSADALPKFAKAVELAYGIEHVENIQNIIAEQNRLTNAWEIFVKSVTEGSGFIGGSLNFLKGVVGGVLGIFTPQSTQDQAAATKKTIELKKELMNESLKIATEEYNKMQSIDKKYENLTKNAKTAFNKWQKAVAENQGKDVAKALHKQYLEANKIVNEADAKIFESQKKEATKKLGLAQKLYDGQKKIVDEIKSDIEEEGFFETAVGNTMGAVSKVLTGGNAQFRTENEKLLNKALQDLAKYEAELEVARKLTETAMPADISEEPKKPARKPSKYRLDEVKDLSNEIKIEELRIQKEKNDALLAGDKASYDERYKAALDNVNILGQLADAEYDESLEKALAYYNKELKDLANAKAEGKIIIGDEEKFKSDLKNKYFQEQELAETKRNNKRLDIERDFAKESAKILERINQDKLDASDKFYNEEIIKANQKYQEGEITYEQLQKELTRITYEQTKARIGLQIKAAEALKNSGDVTASEIIKLDEYIAKLKASLENLKPEEDLEAAWTEKLEKIGEIIAELSNFTDAIFNRRIESINAEIEAEKNKYDALIDLAKGNKDEQVRLQAEKDAKIKQLEAKRLKEEQRAAKYKKAAALVEIAINTAIAVSKVAAQTGIFAPAGIGPIILIGAIQAATVLAQPIPQYKGGLRNSPKDHIGMINDGGRKEYIERDGNILSTSTKNAIVELKKGDTVHKSYDDMVNNSNLFSNLSRSIMLNSLYSKGGEIKLGVDNDGLNKVFDKNLKEMKGVIRDGFKNVTINNTTKVDMDWIAYKNNTL